MKRNLAMLICLFAANFLVSQSKQNEILDRYPFTNAKSIMLASFQNLQKTSDTLEIVECREIPKIKGKIDISGFEKIVKLEKSKYKKLSKIIFSKSIEDNIIGKGYCSETGYAILFFDKLGNVFEYVQFCYNCNTISSSFAQDKLKNDDYEKLNAFKDFFEENDFKIRVYRVGD